MCRQVKKFSLFFYTYICTCMYNNSMYYDLFFVNKFYPFIHLYLKNLREKISRGTKELSDNKIKKNQPFQDNG